MTLKELSEKHGINSKFLEKLNHIQQILSQKNNKIAILHDNDCDGISSYLILKKTYESIHFAHFISKDEKMQHMIIDKVPKDITHILFLDTPDISESVITQLSSYKDTKNTSLKEILILDHHITKKGILKHYNKNEIFYANPIEFNSNDSRAITFWSYILSNENKSQFHQALIGTISDFFTTSLFLDIDISNSQIKELFKPFNLEHICKIQLKLKENPLYFQNENNLNENANIITELSYTTQIGILKQFFDFIFKNPKYSQDYIKEITNEDLFSILGQISAGKYSPFIDFNQYYKKYEKIIQKSYIEFDKQENKDYIIIFHKGRTSYNRQLSEKARFDKDVLISCSMHQKYERDSISGSFRSRDDINLHEILPKLLKNLNGRWGGHKNACGFQIKEEYKEQLIKNIEHYFSK